MIAVVQWAGAHGKHISIFIAKHDAELGKRLRDVFRHGDDFHVPTSCLFFYAQGMLAAATRT